MTTNKMTTIQTNVQDEVLKLNTWEQLTFDLKEKDIFEIERLYHLGKEYEKLKEDSVIIPKKLFNKVSGIINTLWDVNSYDMFETLDTWFNFESEEEQNSIFDDVNKIMREYF